MDFTLERSIRIVAWLLIAIAATQAIYTGMYMAEMEVPRQLLWGGESVLFLVMAAFAAQPMVQSKTYLVAWGAIFVSAILNFIQVGIGLVQFGPFLSVADAYEGAGEVGTSVVAYSFFIYNGAKALLGFAALSFGMAKVKSGAKALGWTTAVVGALAMISNALVMTLGRGVSMPDGPLPGGALGVLATVLLGVCLLSANNSSD